MIKQKFKTVIFVLAFALAGTVAQAGGDLPTVENPDTLTCGRVISLGYSDAESGDELETMIQLDGNGPGVERNIGDYFADVPAELLTVVKGSPEEFLRVPTVETDKIENFNELIYAGSDASLCVSQYFGVVVMIGGEPMFLSDVRLILWVDGQSRQ